MFLESKSLVIQIFPSIVQRTWLRCIISIWKIGLAGIELLTHAHVYQCNEKCWNDIMVFSTPKRELFANTNEKGQQMVDYLHERLVYYIDIKAMYLVKLIP